MRMVAVEVIARREASRERWGPAPEAPALLLQLLWLSDSRA